MIRTAVQIAICLSISLGSTANTASVSGLLSKAESFRETDIDSALHYLCLAAELINDPSDTITFDAIYQSGVLADQHSQYDLAFERLDSALALAERYQHLDRIAKAANSIGVVSLRTGKYDKALENFLRAAEVARTQNDLTTEMTALSNAGHVMYYQGDLDRAMDYYRQAEDRARGAEDVISIARALSNQALIFQAREDFDEAIDMYQEAVDILETHGSDVTLDMANTLQNLGICYKDKKQYDTASYYYERSGAVFEVLRNEEGQAQTLVNVGLMWLDAGDPGEGVSKLQQALSICERIGSLEGRKYAHLGLSDCFTAMENTDSALFHYKRFHAIDDSLMTEAMSARIDELETKYTASENARKIDMLEKEKELDSALITRLVIAIVGILIALVLLGVIYYFWRRNSLLKLKRQRARKYSEEMIRWQETERKRIAGELHDGIGQSLVMIKNQLQRIEVDPDGNPISEGTVDRLEAAVADTIEEVRTISYALRPFYLDLLGLEGAIDELLQEAGKSSKLKITSHISGLSDVVAKHEQIHVFRMVQEAIQNIQKHARATEVDVYTSTKKDVITLTIQDNGIGFDPTVHFQGAGKGLGLRGIKERAALLGGSLRVESTAGKGTGITIEIPLNS